MSSEFTIVLGDRYTEGQEDKLRKRVKSLIRLTYRRDFPCFDPYSITSDAGWGCMLRSAQTLMANVMLRHYFGKDWRLPSNRETILKNEQYIEILKWFVDIPGPPHYFALHHMVQCGIKYSKLPGEWFGPSTVALVLRDIADQQRKKYNGPIAVVVANGDTIYQDDINNLCQFSILSNSSNTLSLEGEQQQERERKVLPESEDKAFFDPLLNQPPASIKQPWLCSLLVLFPLRLGIDRVNEEYYQELKEVLEHDKCVGILGGRPNHALFFAGYNSYNQILGLDPHTTYTSVHIDENFPRDEYLNQVHVNELEKLDITRLDPSLAIGFYFKDRNEFEEWYDEVVESNIVKQECGRVPLFHVGKVTPSYLNYGCFNGIDDDEDDGMNMGEGKKMTHELDNIDMDEMDDSDNNNMNNNNNNMMMMNHGDDDDDYVILPDFK